MRYWRISTFLTFFGGCFLALYFAQARVYINEFVSDPEKGDEEWIELYNDGKEVDLDGWEIYDNTGQDNESKREKLSGKLEENEFLLYQAKFALNNSGDIITLENDEEEIEDEVKYGDKGDISKPGKGQSSGRTEDGGKEWAIFSEPTPRLANIIEKKEYNHEIRINEVLPDPEGTDDGEWIELYNYGSEKINLENWQLKDSSKNGLFLFSSEFLIDPEKLLVIEKADFKFALNNSGGEGVYLYDPNGDLVWETEYGNAETGKTWAYDKETEKWSWSNYPTFEAENVFKIAVPEGVLISEILANPSAPEEEKEFIEIFNDSGEEIDLKDWSLSDAAKSGKYVFKESLLLKPNEYKKIFRKDFKFALNNSAGEKVKLFDPNGDIQDEIILDKSPENVSYNFNPETKKWRWSRFLSPGKANKFNQLPKVKVKKSEDCYREIYCEFEVEVNDKDDKNFKIKWDFGDGRYSYLEETKHKYEKEGNYKIVVEVSDGSETVKKTFKLEIDEFPRDKIRIVSLIPNPIGLDSENEQILVKNESNQKVNLRGWKIATGRNSKVLVNHIINEDFILKPGESRIITRKYSNFSLANQKARIELRYPDNILAYRVKYSREKIGEGEIYQKTDGVWSWIAPVDETEPENMDNETEKITSTPETKELTSEVPETKVEAEQEPVEEGIVLGAKSENEKESFIAKTFKSFWLVFNSFANRTLNKLTNWI